MIREINYIIIHCSDTYTDQFVNASVIDGWHKSRGWDGIGYHFVINIDGTVETGRSIDKIGAHCKARNRDSIGICLIGGRARDINSDGYTNADTFTKNQYISLKSLLKTLRFFYPNIITKGHSDFDKNKLCPCFNLKTHSLYEKL
jgi:N-acetylmuramoyl-L-alanine amidase